MHESRFNLIYNLVLLVGLLALAWLLDNPATLLGLAFMREMTYFGHHEEVYEEEPTRAIGFHEDT